jgi:hypothetical protein
MKRLLVSASLSAVLAAAGLTSSCDAVETTGDSLVRFTPYAAGPTDVTTPLLVDGVPNGFQVSLTSVSMRIGAVYLIEGAYNPGSQNTSCIEPGVYAAQVPGGVQVNLLDPSPQEFSVYGNGTADLGQIGEIWLTGGTTSSPDINAEIDPTPVLTMTGTASRPGESYAFQSTVTISTNRAQPVTDPALPGLNPICKQRIIQFSPIHVQLFQGGSMYVRVDPRGWFHEVDFTTPTCGVDGPTGGGTCDGLQCVTVGSDGSCQLYEIPDTDDSAIGQALFTGIQTGVLASGASAYSIDFTTPSKAGAP